MLTGIGTVYLYRLTQDDLRAFRELPATKLSVDKFRVLLTRLASLHVSEKGILDAGSLAADQVESLTDDEVERLAESYLESTTIRWYRHEGASATLSVIRNPNEPATKFLDRLIHWYAIRGPGGDPESAEKADAFAEAPPPPRPRFAPMDTIAIPRRDAWIALGALALVAVLVLAALAYQYVLVQSLQKRQEDLLTQVKETNALIASHVARTNEENARLRSRIDALEAALRAQAARAREPRPAPRAAPPTPTRPAPAKPRPRR